jgi:hypothetical protein
MLTVMLSLVLQSVIMLSDIIQIANMLSTIKLSYVSWCQFKHLTLFDAECNAESGFAKCHYIECHYSVC